MLNTSTAKIKLRRRSGLRQGFLACAIGIADRSMYQLLIIRCTRCQVPLNEESGFDKEMLDKWYP